MADTASRAIVDRRPYIAGGYNLQALTRYTDMRELTAHLLVGSIGTLGVVTEIRLKLIPQRPSRGTFVAHFRDPDEFAEAALRLKALDPAALEFSDASCSRHVDGKILNLEDPGIVGTLVAEFDQSREQAEAGRAVIEAYAVSRLWEIPAGSPEEAALWEDRRRILPSLWKYCRAQNWLLPSIIDDIAIHLQDFGAVRRELEDLMRRLGHELSLFGHLGFGSIHARPAFDPGRGDLEAQIETVSQETFNLLHTHHGTLVGEPQRGALPLALPGAGTGTGLCLSARDKGPV